MPAVMDSTFLRFLHFLQRVSGIREDKAVVSEDFPQTLKTENFTMEIFRPLGLI